MLQAASRRSVILGTRIERAGATLSTLLQMSLKTTPALLVSLQCILRIPECS